MTTLQLIGIGFALGTLSTGITGIVITYIMLKGKRITSVKPRQSSWMEKSNLDALRHLGGK